MPEPVRVTFAQERELRRLIERLPHHYKELEELLSLTPPVANFAIDELLQEERIVRKLLD